MFEWRHIQFYVAFSALMLAAWTTFVPTPVSVFGWALAGMIGLYAVSAMVLRAGRPKLSVAHALDQAAQVNAARVAAPRPNPSGDTR